MRHLTPDVVDLARRQDGVLCRRQLTRLGARDGDIRRRRSQRLLAGVEDGVHVDHTGEPTRRQREWAAVLLLHPAVLGGTPSTRPSWTWSPRRGTSWRSSASWPRP